LFDNLYGILFCVLNVPMEESMFWMDERSMRSHGQMYYPFFVRLEWTSSHQCTNWPFFPLDGLRFFIQH
jgi:hypothetical protein